MFCVSLTIEPLSETYMIMQAVLVEYRITMRICMKVHACFHGLGEEGGIYCAKNMCGSVVGSLIEMCDFAHSENDLCDT